MSYNIFQLVLDFQQDPSHFEALIGPDKPLPEDTGKLLEEVAGKISSDSDDDNPTDELFSATSFFIERVLFMPGGDLYRQLGLGQSATQEQIRKHYHLLMHLFFLDREDMVADWSAEYADCINRAYSILRDPVKRRDYDARLAGKESVVDSQITYSESDKSFAHSIVSFTEARNQKQVGNKVENEVLSGLNEQLSRSSVMGAASLPSENITIQPDAARVTEENSFIADSIERAYSDIGARAAPVNDEKTPYVNMKELASDEFKKDFHDEISPTWDDANQTVESAYLKRTQGKSSSKTAVILISFIAIVGILAAVYQYQIAPDDSVINNIEKTPLQVQPASESDNVITGSVEREAMPEMVEESAVLSFEAPVAPVSVQDDQPELAVDSGLGSQPQVSASSSAAAGGSPDVTSPVITGLSLSPRRISPPEVEPSAMSAPVQMPDMMQKKVKTLISKPAIPAEKKVKSKDVVVDKSSTAPTSTSQVKVPPPREIEVFPPPRMASPTVKTPSPGTDVGVVASLSPFPEPAPKSVPKTLKQAIHLIPQADLDKMIRTFVRSYEEGDLKTLLSVFAGDARTNDRTDRNGIAEDYRDLFGVAEKRQFIFDDLKWDRTVENHARGKGAFEVKILLKGESLVSTITGQVTIDVERRGKELLITRFFHTYQ